MTQCKYCGDEADPYIVSCGHNLCQECEKDLRDDCHDE